MAVIYDSGKVRGHSGFTLMELLVVMLIVGLLAALVGPSLYQKINPAKRSITKAQIKDFTKALDAFFVDVGRYPNGREGLDALFYQPDGVSGWYGPYIKKEVPPDPWGNPYEYHVPGSHGPYELISYGADGLEGGDGENRDINHWQND